MLEGFVVILLFAITFLIPALIHPKCEVTQMLRVPSDVRTQAVSLNISLHHQGGDPSQRQSYLSSVTDLLYRKSHKSDIQSEGTLDRQTMFL